MSLNWDFTNYTFSFLVSILASILGICYPLFLESIRKIDDQYESSVLSKRFQQEPIFLMYRATLLCVIIVSFAAPFIMMALSNNIVNIIVESIHSIVVLALVLVMLYMFRIIQTYYNPKELVSHLFDGIDTKSPVNDSSLLQSAVDLTRYACRHPNDDVYRKSRGFITRAALAEQMPIEHKTYNLNESLQSALLKLTEYSKDTKMSPLCYDNVVAEVFYYRFCKGYNGDLNYHTVWFALCKMMDSDNTEWFQQYWAAAIQYKTFVLNHATYEEMQTDEYKTANNRFLELHYVLGAMLVYCEKYDWLHHILTTDHVSPPNFHLIPGTLASVIENIERLDNQTQNPNILMAKYQMKGLFHNIDCDYEILKQCYRYFALLLIRVFCYNDYNIGYCHPMTFPVIDSLDLNQLKEMKRIIARLRSEVIEYWYKDSHISRVNLYKAPEEGEVLELIDGFDGAINVKIQYHIENPELDTAKFLELKELLSEYDNREKPLTKPVNDEIRGGWSSSVISIIFEEQLGANICSKDGFRSWSNFPEAFLHTLRIKIKDYLDGHFSHVFKPIVDLRICERNVFTALKRLNIGEGYSILSMGVYLGSLDMRYNSLPLLKYENDSCHFGSIPVIECNSSMSVILIIRTDDMPRIEAMAEDDSGKMAEKQMNLLTGSDNNLFTNIDQIIADDSATPVIRIGKVIRMFYNNDLRFIRICVMQDGDDSAELNNIKELKECIGL